MQKIAAQNDKPFGTCFAKHANETYIKMKEAKTASVEADHTSVVYCPLFDHMVSVFGAK